MRLRMLLVPLLATLVLLTGCTALADPIADETPTPVSNGVELLPADEILDRAYAAVQGAHSLRVSGVFGADPLAADVYLVFAGGDLQGNGTVLGLRIDAIRKGSDFYAKGDASLFIALVPTAIGSDLSSFSNKWVRMPVTYVSWLPVPLTVPDLVSQLRASGPLTKGEPGTLDDGTPVITVTDSAGTVYSVATAGEPYLLRVADGGGTPTTLSDFEAEITIAAPTPYTDVADLL